MSKVGAVAATPLSGVRLLICMEVLIGFFPHTCSSNNSFSETFVVLPEKQVLFHCSIVYLVVKSLLTL